MLCCYAVWINVKPENHNFINESRVQRSRKYRHLRHCRLLCTRKWSSCSSPSPSSLAIQRTIQNRALNELRTQPTANSIVQLLVFVCRGISDLMNDSRKHCITNYSHQINFLWPAAENVNGHGQRLETWRQQFKGWSRQIWAEQQEPTGAVYHYLPTMVQWHNTQSLEAESIKTYKHCSSLPANHGSMTQHTKSGSWINENLLVLFIITYQQRFNDTTHQVWKLNQWNENTSTLISYKCSKSSGQMTKKTCLAQPISACLCTVNNNNNNEHPFSNEP